MAGQYYKVKDDGAKWRCSQCQRLKSFELVILFIPTEIEKATYSQKILCLDCVDDDWFEDAICLGEK